MKFLFLEFVKEFFYALFGGQKLAASVTKIAIALLLVVSPPIVATTKVAFVFGDAQSPSFEPTIGTLFSAIVSLILVSACLALAWERCRRFMLRLADNIDPTEEGKYWLTVTNDGHGEALARLFVTDIVFVYRLTPTLGKDEERRDSLFPHPVEIRWADYDPQKREPVPISSGHPGRALLLLNVTHENCQHLSLGGVMGDSPVVNLEAFRGCLLWIKVLAKDQNGKPTEKWFVLTMEDVKTGWLCQCAAAPPPIEVIAATQNAKHLKGRSDDPDEDWFRSGGGLRDRGD